MRKLFKKKTKNDGYVWFRVEGLKEIEAALLDLEFSVAQTLTRKGLKAAIEPVHQDVLADIPVHDGALKQSVRMQTSSAAPLKKTSTAYMEASVSMGGKKAPHAINVEYGTRFQKEQPVLRRAHARNVHKSLNLFKTTMTDGIEKVRAKHARKAARAAKARIKK